MFAPRVAGFAPRRRPGAQRVSAETRQPDRGGSQQRGSGEHGPRVQPGQQRQPVCGSAARDDPDHDRDEHALHEAQRCRHQADDAGAGEQGERCIQRREQGAHQVSTQTRISWSAKLCGVAVHTG